MILWMEVISCNLLSDTISRKGLGCEFWRVAYQSQYDPSWCIQIPGIMLAHWVFDVSHLSFFYSWSRDMKTFVVWSVILSRLGFPLTSSPAAPMMHCIVGVFPSISLQFLLIFMDQLLWRSWRDAWIDKYRHGQCLDGWASRYLPWTCCFGPSKLRGVCVCMPSFIKLIDSQILGHLTS